ncbi:hypothetical protein [Oceanisphaera avium]|uniref:Uncharacterized protein n=1 Tax=Oceanisphaera avium TaxID=1903694 RepID=A0A1Y0CVD8_9GAMM|nr:hypothetical protein [Oceanisphaera avium]ART79178.1 hypothetical protein CBP12_02635 [Oceanisphaera avium]
MSLRTLNSALISLSCAFIFSLGTASAASHLYDTSLADTPCKLVPPQVVATALDLPQDKLQQLDRVAPFFFYVLEEGEQHLQLSVTVFTDDSVNAAKKDFNKLTENRTAAPTVILGVPRYFLKQDSDFQHATEVSR